MIRHGQASFHGDDYDVLSPLGIRQSELLARHLAGAGIIADRVFCGTMRRHRETLVAMEEVFSQTAPLPSAVFMDGLREYDHDALFRVLVPLMTQEDSSMADTLAKVRQDRSAFQRFFRMVVDRWLSGRFPAGSVESWQEFSGRVMEAVGTILDSGGKRIFVITSGGPVSVLAGAALGLSPDRTIRLGWEIANCSISRFRSGSSGPVLAVFNAFGHLEAGGDGCVTYR